MNTNSDALSRIATISPVVLLQHVALDYETFCQNIRIKPVLNFNVIEIERDLFQAAEDFALEYCVSADIKMSQGIAWKFRRRFERVDELINQNKKIAKIASRFAS